MAERGTPAWAIYHVRAIGLPRLIDDLEKFEHAGIPEARCADIKALLAGMITDTEGQADAFWSPCVSADLHTFRDAYVKWNDRRQGADLVDRAHRRAAIEKLRNTRAAMKRALERGSKKGNLLATQADRAFADSFYNRVTQFVEKYPGVFVGLSKGAKAYVAAISSDTAQTKV